ncbi:MAG TPA: hypothetical protein VGX68_20695 [Thermoanaerobaculia bacterium]|jgi:hypothetical protein|nr:hypothetical protein [Thermoanaerobaculia bacterium]
MSRPSIRRAIAGLALAALFAAPASGASLWLTGGFAPQDLWSRAWSWFTELWAERGIAEPAAAPRNPSKIVPGTSPPPKPPPQAERPGDNDDDMGGGLDPDG